MAVRKHVVRVSGHIPAGVTVTAGEGNVLVFECHDSATEKQMARSLRIIADVMDPPEVDGQ